MIGESLCVLSEAWTWAYTDPRMRAYEKNSDMLIPKHTSIIVTYRSSLKHCATCKRSLDLKQVIVGDLGKV